MGTNPPLNIDNSAVQTDILHTLQQLVGLVNQNGSQKYVIPSMGSNGMTTFQASQVYGNTALYSAATGAATAANIAAVQNALQNPNGMLAKAMMANPETAGAYKKLTSKDTAIGSLALRELMPFVNQWSGVGDRGTIAQVLAQNTHSIVNPILQMNAESRGSVLNSLSDGAINARSTAAEILTTAADRAIYNGSNFADKKITNGLTETQMAPIITELLSGKNAKIQGLIANTMSSSEETRKEAEDSLTETFKKVLGETTKLVSGFQDLFGSVEDAQKALTEIAGTDWINNSSVNSQLQRQQQELVGLSTAYGVDPKAAGAMLLNAVQKEKMISGLSQQDIALGFANTAMMTETAGRSVKNQIRRVANGENADLVSAEQDAVNEAESGSAIRGLSILAVKNLSGSQLEKYRALAESGNAEDRKKARQMVADAMSLSDEQLNKIIFDPVSMAEQERHLTEQQAKQALDIENASFSNMTESNYDLNWDSEALKSSMDILSKSGVSGSTATGKAEKAKRDALIKQLRESGDPNAAKVADELEASSGQSITAQKKAFQNAMEAVKSGAFSGMSYADVVSNISGSTSDAIKTELNQGSGVTEDTFGNSFVSDFLSGAGVFSSENLSKFGENQGTATKSNVGRGLYKAAQELFKIAADSGVDSLSSYKKRIMDALDSGDYETAGNLINEFSKIVSSSSATASARVSGISGNSTFTASAALSETDIANGNSQEYQLANKSTAEQMFGEDSAVNRSAVNNIRKNTSVSSETEDTEIALAQLTGRQQEHQSRFDSGGEKLLRALLTGKGGLQDVFLNENWTNRDENGNIIGIDVARELLGSEYSGLSDTAVVDYFKGATGQKALGDFQKDMQKRKSEWIKGNKSDLKKKYEEAGGKEKTGKSLDEWMTDQYMSNENGYKADLTQARSRFSDISESGVSMGTESTPMYVRVVNADDIGNATKTEQLTGGALP